MNEGNEIPSLALHDEDQEVPNSFKDVLSFVGIQLQSHAAIILGLALLTFAIIQAWGQLPEQFRSDYYRGFAFSAFVGLLGAGVIYELRRLYVYGKLASAVLYAGNRGFNDAKAYFVRAHPWEVWTNFSTFLKIMTYAQYQLGQSSMFWRKLRVFSLKERGEGIRGRFWVLGASFLATFAGSFGLVFWKFDLQVFLELPVALLTVVVLDLWWSESLGEQFKRWLGLSK